MRRGLKVGFLHGWVQIFSLKTGWVCTYMCVEMPSSTICAALCCSEVQFFWWFHYDLGWHFIWCEDRYSFLALFRNEIMIILTCSTSERVSRGVGCGHIFHFGSSRLQVHNVNIFIYLCIRMHDIIHSFVPIFMKFTWLVWVHSWVNPIYYASIRSL